MSRIGLLPSEALRPKMAGIGIRYLELARRLPAYGLEVVLVNPGPLEDVPATGLPTDCLRRFERGRLGELLGDCDAVISQGQLANDVVVELPDMPTALDFYDPFMIENLHYLEALGLDPYRNDHATWVLQLSRGDFFLCSSDEQRQFYLGFLAALGRVNPHSVAVDEDLEQLIAVVPFGVPEELPDPAPLLPEPRRGERRLLFGGLYDWYDPWPVLRVMERCREEPWTLMVIRNPNPGTPQKLFDEVAAWCQQRGLWQTSVQVLDWLPGDRRFDLLREVDLMVATHRLSLETRLSLRTRFLDALAADCPVVSTEGGAMSRMLAQHRAGWIVPEGDDAAVEAAFRDILAGGEAVQQRLTAGRTLLDDFSWNRALEPLVRFCRQPRQDPNKKDFAFRPPTSAPADSLAFRARRKLRRKLRQWLGELLPESKT